jgi:hypothetical protein
MVSLKKVNTYCPVFLKTLIIFFITTKTFFTRTTQHKNEL